METRSSFGKGEAAVLGGVSLFGGRGSVIGNRVRGDPHADRAERPETSFNADPYIYPLVTAAIIFIALRSTACAHGSSTS